MAARRTGATTKRCPSCRAPIYRQFVDVLDVTADATPINRADEPQLRQPNRLTWCLTTTTWTPARLRWRCPEYATRCDHQVLIEHQCATAQPPPHTTEQTAQTELF